MGATAGAPLALPTISVELPDGEVVVAEVRRSPRVRVTRIQVGADRPLRVVVPDGASDEFAADAVRNKAGWVKTKLRLVEQTREGAAVLGLAQSGVAWHAGQPVRLAVTDVRAARLADGVLRLPEQNPTAALRRWYRAQAKTYLRGLVAEEVERLGLHPTAVVVRDQRTRWGSCSAAGTISLNWRLLIAPDDVARYVVVHELAHLRHPNHSKAFWRAVSGALPGWRFSADWLRVHGYELREFDASTAVA